MSRRSVQKRCPSKRGRLTLTELLRTCLLILLRPDKEKDLGIPSKFPFKDQILAEAAEVKAKVSAACS